MRSIWRAVGCGVLVQGLCGVMMGGVALAQADAQAAQAAKEPPPKTEFPIARPMEYLRKDAARLLGSVQSVGAHRYLFATNWAPIVEESRYVYFNKQTREAYTPEEFAGIPQEKGEGFKLLVLDEQFYYQTFYGSPHAYTRAIDLACMAMEPEKGDAFKPKMRVMDFGCGGIVHLRNLASLGMNVVGIDVDPILKAFYRQDQDYGKIPGVQDGEREGPLGILQMEFGSWPGDAGLRGRVGGGFDLIMSKNTLKKGYITPDVPVDDRVRVKLGVPNEDFVAALFNALKPGGVLMIYNICPAQKKPEEGFIPWADGRNPFPKEMWTKAGFEIKEFDKDDSEAVRAMGKALGWNEGETPMDLEKDLFASYSLLVRPADPAATDAKPATAPAAPAPKK